MKLSSTLPLVLTLALVGCSDSPSDSGEPNAAAVLQSTGAAAVIEASEELGVSGVAPAGAGSIPAETPDGARTVRNPTLTPILRPFAPALGRETIGEKKAALFFAAGWDGAATEISRQIQERTKDFNPEAVILQVDLDANGTLAQEYGAVGTHSIVLLDASGDATKVLENPTTDELVAFFE